MHGDGIYIGVDGGGTKTALGAFNSAGELISECTVGSLNYNFIGQEKALAHLEAGIDALAVPRAQIRACGIGDPSIDDFSESEAAQRFLSEAERRLGVPVLIRSDAYVTLYGLTGGKEAGVLVISGTGAMGIAEDADGRISVAGGWGRLTGDEGSGYDIGLRGISSALRAADGIGRETELLPAALAYFSVSSPRRLIERFYGAEEPDVAGFARCVADCAEKGDACAEEILLSAARYLADCASVLVRKSGATLVGVYGSVLLKNRTVRAEFERCVKERHPDVIVREPAVTAQKSAALYAMQKEKEKTV